MDTKKMKNEKLKVKNEKIACLPLFIFHSSFFIRLVFLFSFFILHSSFVMAQNSGYSLDLSSGEPLFTQRLSWNSDEYARRYEVIIEKEEGGRYRELRRESTRESFIEVSLAPGKYRYYVIPYDYLGQAGERSEMEIDVLPAFLPELDDSLDEFVYPAKTAVYEMTFSGKDIAPGAEIYLRRLGDTGIAGGELVPGERIVPSEVHIKEDGSEVRLLFDKKQLSSGDFELIVKNPGGLETSKGGITVTRSDDRKINIFLTAAWMPLSPLYYEEEKRFPGQNLSAVGAAGRLGVTFTRWDSFNPGLELAASWCLIDTGSGGRNSAEYSAAQTLVLGLNLLARKWLPNERIAFTFRAGPGYTMLLPDLHLIHINMGVSFLCVFALNLYMETGLDYNHWFTESPFGSACLRPWVGLGWRF